MIDATRYRRDCAGRRTVRSEQSGFTLIEALVVLVIIGLIMGLVAPRVLNYLSSSKEKAAPITVTVHSILLILRQGLFFISAKERRI